MTVLLHTALQAELLLNGVLQLQPNPDVPELDPDTVTSGPLGFAIIALSALAVIGLSFPLVRTLRRISYREQVRAEIAEELAARDAAAAAGAVDAGSGAAAAAEATDTAEATDAAAAAPQNPERPAA